MTGHHPGTDADAPLSADQVAALQALTEFRGAERDTLREALAVANARVKKLEGLLRCPVDEWGGCAFCHTDDFSKHKHGCEIAEALAPEVKP